ncbi:LPS export ABC transporter periplasmic protein LptC [Sphingomonas donggukensis]|uniref:LPS export ABC transporter periplasmic protein LptC n=1 Tax=Sphingomonas donggukensis TaxID=2949093 RepID=A0ABY4TTT8_9SPHN|nr:LPS export ABC transporter periplasmic protein LptC [Sphingomonas donggukensis]URW75806.1 LPS export ABC transporter periplasmic protein LptC [Sphingomonas donggukensis]
MSDVARAIRTERQIWAAPGSSHDRLVAILQVGLPMAIGVLAAFLVMAPLFAGGDVSFVLDKNKVDVAGERMKIETARYQGADDKGRAFQLTAGSAVQKSSAEPIVRMNALAAELEMADGPAQLKADSGRYDMTSERVAIDGPIRFTGPNNYVLGTRDATVDLKTRKLASGGAVAGSTPMGTFSGDRLTADLEQRTVALRGNARLRIVPGRAKRAP